MNCVKLGELSCLII